MPVRPSSVSGWSDVSPSLPLRRLGGGVTPRTGGATACTPGRGLPEPRPPHLPPPGRARCRNSTHCGYLSLMEAVTTIDTVRTFDTRGGNTRYVVRDVDGHEYTTFRETIGDRAS